MRKIESRQAPLPTIPPAQSIPPCRQTLTTPTAPTTSKDVSRTISRLIRRQVAPGTVTAAIQLIVDYVDKEAQEKELLKRKYAEVTDELANRRKKTTKTHDYIDRGKLLTLERTQILVREANEKRLREQTLKSLKDRRKALFARIVICKDESKALKKTARNKRIALNQHLTQLKQTTAEMTKDRVNTRRIADNNRRALSQSQSLFATDNHICP